MAQPLSDSSLLMTPDQDATNPHPNPGVQWRERPLGAVFEVLEPASHHSGDTFDDSRQAVPVQPPRERADSVLELHEALFSGMLALPLEVVTEEVEASTMIYARHPRLVSMEREATCAELLAQPCESLLGLPFGLAKRMTRSSA